MGSCATCRRSFDAGIEVCPDDGVALLPDDVVAAAAADLAPGTVVGEYVVSRKLGEGAYGAVYAAEHAVIGKRAALKLLNKRYSSDLAIVSRFVTEARAVNRIRHPNIVDIFAFGQHEGQHYLAMELLEGTSLDEHLRRRGRLSVEEALPILRGVAEALDAAHDKGIVHRDLKPDNVFLVRDKAGARVPKLLDFGVAKLQADGESSHKTATGIAIGTPYYMSPEQCRGRKVEAASDIYALGAMTYQMLTGRPPFEGESVMDVLMKHMHETAPPMSSVDPRFAGMIDAAVATMLAKKADARPATASAAIELLAAAAGAPALATSATVQVPTPVEARRLELATVVEAAPGEDPATVREAEGPGVDASPDTSAAGDPAEPGEAHASRAPGSTLRSASDETVAATTSEIDDAGRAAPAVATPKNTTLGAVSSAPVVPSSRRGAWVGIGAAIAAVAVAALVWPRSEAEAPAPGVEATTASRAPTATAVPSGDAPVTGAASGDAPATGAAPPSVAPLDEPLAGGTSAPAAPAASIPTPRASASATARRPPAASASSPSSRGAPPPSPSASGPAPKPPGNILESRD